MYRNYQPYPPQINFSGAHPCEPPPPKPNFNCNGGQYWDRDRGGGVENGNGHNHNSYQPGPQRPFNDYQMNGWSGPRGFRGGRGGRGRGGGRGGQQQRGHPGNRHAGSADQTNHKPWMTDELLKLIKERDELQQKAIQSKNPDDWSIFKAVSKRTGLTLNDAKRLYELNKPFEPSVVENKKEKKSLFNCDTCDRGFPTEEIWNQHNSEHVTCKLDGCQFTAQPKVILKHIEIQHSNNLYIRLKGFETPEEIQKWIELRKSKYPTEQNIQKKKEEMAERHKRGERFPVNGMRENSFRKNSSWNSRQESKFQRGGRTDRQHSATDSSHTPQNTIENSTPPPNLEARTELSNSSEPIKPARNSEVSSVTQGIDERKSRYPPRQQFSFGEENIPNVTPEFTKCSKNVIVLENFYSKVRIGENGNLVGKKIMVWNGEAQKLCQKIARTGLPMKNCQEGPNVESDDSDDDDDVDDVITDEEDVSPDMTNLSSARLGPETGIFAKLDIPVQCSKSQVESSVKDTAVSAPVPQKSSLCLVNYSSDSESDGEAPDEVPAVIVKEKEEGEINDDNDKPPEVPKMKEDTSLSTAEITQGSTRKGRKPKTMEKNHGNEVASKNVGGRGRIAARRRHPRMPKLLKKLLEDDIRRERNQILQVCRYIVENKFFEADVSVTVNPQECVQSKSESESETTLKAGDEKE